MNFVFMFSSVRIRMQAPKAFEIVVAGDQYRLNLAQYNDDIQSIVHKRRGEKQRG